MAETIAERTKPNEIPLPHGAIQMFGEYIQQQLEEQKLLEGVERSKSDRLVSLLSNLTSKEKILVIKANWDFDFLKGKPASMPNTVSLDNEETREFLNAVDHNIRNAFMPIMRSNEAAGMAIGRVLNRFSNYREIQISRNGNGRIEVIPFSKIAVVG